MWIPFVSPYGDTYLIRSANQEHVTDMHVTDMHHRYAEAAGLRPPLRRTDGSDSYL